jgi:polyphosphate:AMP phosphotransferase
MFATAELGHKIDAETFEREAERLRKALVEAQYRLKASPDFPVVVLVNGVEGAGKSETVNLLTEWMDPRLINSKAFADETDEERDRPFMWRFWRALPPKGRIGVFFGSWYTDPLHARATGKSRASELEESLAAITRFETMLVREGALLLKFWFHIDERTQKKRLEKLEGDKRTSWRVTKKDWRAHALYDEQRAVAEHALSVTSTSDAPWIVVEGTDEAYRSLTVAGTLERALRERLGAKKPARAKRDAPLLTPPLDGVHVLDKLDMTKTVDKKTYERELEELQGELARLTRKKAFRERALVAVFEGNDAAGKGGAIRRVTAALDARKYEVVPVAAPTEEERAQPYLWRFWRHVPKHGGITIFDRSWYGRVLVERVERYCAEADYMRAYGEINDFETELTNEGVIVVKHWLAVSRDEQLTRFREREATDWKRFKITEDDWRNRKKWKQYAHAVHDMVERTSPAHAPWHIVPANDKRYARLTVLRGIVEALGAALA